jgi:hypothetical protein
VFDESKKKCDFTTKCKLYEAMEIETSEAPENAEPSINGTV